MKPNAFLLWLKQRSARLFSHHNFDKKLLNRVGGRLLPGWSQLKYLGKFLNPTEKKIAGISLVVLALAGLGLSVGWVRGHLVAAPARGGDYSEALIGQPKYLNPLFASTSDVDADLTSLIYSGLVRYSPQDQKMVPDVAESYTVSPDQKIYTFTLRPNLHWSDGEPLTIDDVLYTFESIQNPEVGSPLLAAFQGVAIQKTSSTTLTFTLKDAFGPFLSSLVVGILPSHVWTAITPATIKLAKNNLQPIGSGPWQFNKLVKRDQSGALQSYVLNRNPYYYGAVPQFDTLTFKFVNDYDQAVEALQNNQVRVISWLPRAAKKTIAASAYHFYPIKLSQYTALFLNQTQQPLLKNDDVRHALAIGIDKVGLIAGALDGEAEALDSPLLPGTLGYDDSQKRLAFSLDAANALLDKKWTRMAPEDYFAARRAVLVKQNTPPKPTTSQPTSTSTAATPSTTLTLSDEALTTQVRAEMNTSPQPLYRQAKDGTFRELTITTADTPEYGAVAEAIATNWRALGVRTAVETIASRSLVRSVIKQRTFQTLLYGEILGADADLYPFWHSSQTDYPGLNIAGFVNRTADKLLETARSATDDTARATAYQKFADIMATDIPAIFLYTPTYTVVAERGIKGLTFAPLSKPTDRYSTLAQWYTKTKWRWK